MSLVQLRVELPTYAHSFTLQVPNSSTILEVKQEIFKSCIGSPRVEGQRIIWRGRYLADDEKLEALWKSPDEPRIIHLSVHPSAWKSNPPNVNQKPHSSTPSASLTPAASTVRISSQMPHPVQSPPTAPAHTPTPTALVPTTPPTYPLSLAYVHARHRRALSALTPGMPPPDDESAESEQSRSAAVQFVERHGYIWPTILDQAFPPFEQGGLRYERRVIEGRPFLSLSNPSEKPTAAQLHALNVLSYTLTLLKLPSEPPITQPAAHSQPVQVPAHLNALLQQLGLPPVQGPPVVPPGRNIVMEAREIPIRPFLLPLVMLLFRTLLLLYFVAPARKPVFGILILAWVLYEIWQPIRNGFARGWQRAVEAEQQGHAADAAQRGVPNGDQPNNVAANPPQPRAPAPGTDAATGQAGAVFDTLANIDIQEEEAALVGQAPEEPRVGRKVVTFLTLLLTSVHPAIWNRRRRVLRQREGRIRTEASAREAENEGEGDAQDERRTAARAELLARHANRPRWIQNYIHRVIQGEWVDDSD